MAKKGIANSPPANKIQNQFPQQATIPCAKGTELTMIWRDWFNHGPYLVQISPQRVKITNLYNNRVWEDAPLVAIAEDAKGIKTIFAIGSVAKGKADLVVNPFDHPRTFLHDFTVAESLLKYALRSLMHNHLFTIAPVIIMQVTEPMEGGMTQIEHRALRELAIGAGARKVYIYEKHTPPTLEELRTFKAM